MELHKGCWALAAVALFVTHARAVMQFPDCVDPDKITDYTYAALHGGRCPANMKRLPRLRFSIRYNTRKAIPQGWKGVPPFKLACGEVYEPELLS